MSQVKKEFQRGWGVVLASSVGAAFGVLSAPSALAFMMKPLHDEFGWGRSQVAAAATCLTIGIFLAGPWFGRIYDRYGVRRVAPFAIVIFSCLLLAVSRMPNSLWTFYAAYFALGTLGVGTSFVAYSRAVAASFENARGVALALTMAGQALSTATMPFILPGLITEFGWRGAYVALGLAALIPLVPIAIFIPRRTESEMRKARTDAGSEDGSTMREALSDRRFWGMAIGIFSIGLGLVGIHLHTMPMLTDMGASQSSAAHAIFFYGFGILLGRVVTGVLLDRFFAPFVAGGLFILPPLGFALFHFFGLPFAPVLMLMVGLATGAEADALGYLTSRYFGLKAYSEIFSWLYGALALGAAGSPLLLGYLFDRFGDYQEGLIVASVLCLFSSLLFLTLGRYPSESQQAG